MTDRTALETADDWRNNPMQVANCYNTQKYAAILLRRQHAEIERLRDGLSVIANGRCADVGADVYADRVLMGIENETD